MKARKVTSVTVSLTELLALIRGQLTLPGAVRFTIPELDKDVDVVPLHGPAARTGDCGPFSAIRISWEEEA